jgi:hypothetical protein
LVKSSRARSWAPLTPRDERVLDACHRVLMALVRVAHGTLLTAARGWLKPDHHHKAWQQAVAGVDLTVASA